MTNPTYACLTRPIDSTAEDNSESAPAFHENSARVFSWKAGANYSPLWEHRSAPLYGRRTARINVHAVSGCCVSAIKPKTPRNRGALLGVLILLLTAAGVPLTTALHAGNAPKPRVRVPLTQNLRAEGKRSLKKRIPIMLVFFDSSCPYCELLDENILRPMLLSGEYTNRVRLVKIMLDDRTEILDFQGRPVEPAVFAERYGSTLTPTILFLDSRGRELSKKIVGIAGLDYFQYYVDEAIVESLKKLRSPAAGSRPR